MPENLTSHIDWFGHDSFRYRGSKTVYFDPWKIHETLVDGDLILVTHSHYDHYSPEDIERVATSGATLIFPASMKEEVSFDHSRFMAPGESMDLDGILLEAIPAYNTNKKFHPRVNGWLGYVLTIDGIRIYHAGDTDLIDEMNSVSCDIALLPVSGTYVMTADEAIKATQMIGPKVAIPMHWGDIVGGRADAENFRVGASCPVVIKEAQG